MQFIKRESVHKDTIALQVYIILFHVQWELTKLATKHLQHRVSLSHKVTTTMNLPKYSLKSKLNFAHQVTTA